MSTLAAATAGTVATVDSPAARRRARALVARRLLAATRSVDAGVGAGTGGGHDSGDGTTATVASDLDWETLDAVPAWFALPDEALLRLACRVGARVHAATLGHWIDNGRLCAARRAVGAEFLRALLASTPSPVAVEPGPRPTAPAAATAADVEPLLRACGFAVLLAALPAPIRAAAPRLWAPVAPAPMIDVLARSLIADVERLGLPIAPAPAGPGGEP